MKMMNFNKQTRSCHAEHIRYAECELREVSGYLSREILRSAQDDIASAQDDIASAQDDIASTQDDTGR